MSKLKVVVAETDTLCQKLYVDLINKEDGYIMLKSVSELKELEETLFANQIDLVILNFCLKNFTSLNSLEFLRKKFPNTEYIVIFEKENREVEHNIFKYGVFKHFVVPFSFELFRQTLKDYLVYHESAINEVGEDCREAFEGSKRGHYWANNKPFVLPGLSGERLDDIESFLRENPDTYSAREIGSSLGFSLATARRHLEFLVTKGRIEVKFAHKHLGRPEKRYSSMLI